MGNTLKYVFSREQMKKSAIKMTTALIDGLPLVFILFLIGAFTSIILHAQAPGQAQLSQGTPFIDMVPGSKNVWFFIFIGWYVFSAMTAGMPEPTQDSSPWYIWAYRSFHILSASGTSFFQNKMYWPNALSDTRVTQPIDRDVAARGR